MHVEQSPPAAGRLLGLLASMALTGVVLYHFHNRFWWPPDEGAYAHVAARMVTGEVLNGEVQDVHLGYINFANALALRVFGDDLVSLRYPLVFLGIVQAGLTYCLLLQRGVWSAVVAAAAMTGLSFVQFLNPTAHWYCLFWLVATVAALVWIPQDWRLRLATIGWLVATIFLFRQLTGVITAIGVVTYLLWECRADARGRDAALARATNLIMAGGLACYLASKVDLTGLFLYGLAPLGVLVGSAFKATTPNRAVLRIVVGLACGAVVAMAPLVLYHLWHGTVGSWMSDTIICAASLTELNFVHDFNYRMLSGAAIGQLLAPRSVAEFFNGLFWTLSPWLAVLLGWVVLCDLIRSRRPVTAAPLPMVAVFYTVVSLHYQIPIYLFYTLPVTVVALIWIACQSSRFRRQGFLAMATALTLIGLYYQAGQPVSRGLAGTLKGDRKPLVRSSGLRRCSLWIERDDNELYLDLVGLVDADVAEDESILAVPVNPELYYLTGRTNPFRFFNTALGIQGKQDLLQAQEILLRQPPKLIFHRPDDKYNTRFARELIQFAKLRYTLHARLGGFEVYRYRGQEAP